jgi:hypothetical protein
MKLKNLAPRKLGMIRLRAAAARGAEPENLHKKRWQRAMSDAASPSPIAAGN